MATDGTLLKTIASQEREILRLRNILQENNISVEEKEPQQQSKCVPTAESGNFPLCREDVSRYSRQLLIPEFGVSGQLALKNTSVLIVGAGGLGCPVAVYLAAAGVGTIGVIDYDVVEISNLHRQILHSELKVGITKVQSLISALRQLNSSVKYFPHEVLLNRSNIKDIIQAYDIVVDATDNVATRYLLNDSCVLFKKPLVSGSALRWEGQLTVYNYKGGPCYRCLFPEPPPPDMVTNCSDGGVIGAVPGVIGCLQALEVIKIVTGSGDVYNNQLLMFDGLSGRFRLIKLRKRNDNCSICGVNPTITELIDYVQFCGSGPSDKEANLTVLPQDQRISCKELQNMRQLKLPHLLIDVRPALEFSICHLSESKNIPFECLEEHMSDVKNDVNNFVSSHPDGSVLLLCRRGNNSQIAVQMLKKHLSHNVNLKDVTGGLTSWANCVDPEFPIY